MLLDSGKRDNDFGEKHSNSSTAGSLADDWDRGERKSQWKKKGACIMTNYNFAQRLRRLEAQNRRLRAAAAASISLAVSLWLMGRVRLQRFGGPSLSASLDNALSFAENELVALSLVIAVVTVSLLLLRFARKAANSIDRSSIATGIRSQVAEEAVAKLIQARRLLEESDSNFERALRLRNEAVKHDLPSVHVAIKGKNPRNLLTDVDRRIESARSRLYVKKEKELRAAEESLAARIRDDSASMDSRSRSKRASHQKLNERIQTRLLQDLESLAPGYESDKLKKLRNHAQRAKVHQRRNAILGLLAAAAVMGAAAVLLFATKGGGGFSNSFSFLG